MTASNRPFDLICFDVDGTLVVHPEETIVWEILNRRFTGDDEANQTRFRQYRAGEISYPEWVALDVGDWLRAGATRDEIVAAIGDLRLVGGTHETLAELKRRGYKLAIISGTLDVVIETLLPEHPFDDVFVNHLDFDAAGRLSGWKATPYDVDGKARAVREIAAREGIPIARCAFVGDAFNDVEAAREAGFSVAFNPEVRRDDRGLRCRRRGRRPEHAPAAVSRLTPPALARSRVPLPVPFGLLEFAFAAQPFGNPTGSPAALTPPAPEKGLTSCDIIVISYRYQERGPFHDP